MCQNSLLRPATQSHDLMGGGASRRCDATCCEKTLNAPTDIASPTSIRLPGCTVLSVAECCAATPVVGRHAVIISSLSKNRYPLAYKRAKRAYHSVFLRVEGRVISSICPSLSPAKRPRLAASPGGSFDKSGIDTASSVAAEPLVD